MATAERPESGSHEQLNAVEWHKKNEISIIEPPFDVFRSKAFINIVRPFATKSMELNFSLLISNWARLVPVFDNSYVR